MTTEFKTILLRGGTAGQWSSANPVLADREIAVEEATSPATSPRLKVGDGVTAWNSLKYVDDDQFSAFVAKAGDTMTGNLSIVRNGAVPSVILDSDIGQFAEVAFLHDGEYRWVVRMSNDAESGGNAGSHLDLVRFDDNGVVIGIVARWYRDSGVTDFPGGLNHPSPGPSADNIQSATTEWVRDRINEVAMSKTSLSVVPASTVVAASNGRAVQTNLVPALTASIHTSGATGITVPAGAHMVTARVQWNAASSVARAPAVYDGTNWYMLSTVANNANELQQTYSVVVFTAAPTLLQFGTIVLSITGSLRTLDGTGGTFSVVTL